MSGDRSITVSVINLEPRGWRWILHDGAHQDCDFDDAASELDAWLAASVAVRAVIARRVEALR